MTMPIDLNPISEPLQLPVVPGFRVVSTDVGTHGEIIRMWVADGDAEQLFQMDQRASGSKFPRTRTEDAYSTIVLATDRAGTREQKLPELSSTFPIVQKLPEGDVLVVAPRCQRFKDGTHEMNALVFDARGGVRDFCLGDGIQHVQVDKSGRIWVGYFDEGVFGNFGWGISGASQPLGAAGLVCYDQSGRATWEFSPTDGLEYIADCYALNVAEEYVWACYYTDFPIIRIDPQGRVDGWRTDLSGPCELAAEGTSVLSFGGYSGHRNDCVLLKLGEDRAEMRADVKLRLPDSVDLDKAYVKGRGAMLYVVDNHTLFTFRVPSD